MAIVGHSGFFKVNTPDNYDFSNAEAKKYKFCNGKFELL